MFTAQHADLQIRRRVSCRYLLHVPAGCRPGARRRWPLVLFLHGAGERGNDLERVKVHGPPRLAAAGQRLPFLCVAPQCPAGEGWQTAPLEALLDRLQDRYPVAADRVYVTGLSMGGLGTWALLAACPQRFAAAAPICAPRLWLPPERLRRLPIWCFHGALDPVVPCDDSIRMVQRLREAGCPVRFTVYPDAGHDAWTATYADAAFWEWLLGQRRGAAQA